MHKTLGATQEKDSGWKSLGPVLNFTFLNARRLLGEAGVQGEVGGIGFGQFEQQGCVLGGLGRPINNQAMRPSLL